MDRWSPGDTVVVRNIARSDDSVSMAMPAIAIRDDDRILALFIPAGTVAKDNYAVPDAQRVAAVETTPPSRHRPFVDRRWLAHTLRLHPPDTAFSVWLFFDDRGGVAAWYGNLEAPYRRTPIGIDTRDHALDVVADAAGRWRWKDEDEFARRGEAGIDTPQHQAAVRAAGREFISRLERRAPPFDMGWETWHAPPDWQPRTLPENWTDDFGTGALLR
ncbi:MAG TPA: DUF402 domain-containing protein [Rhizomicrobium sp.]|jgi:hypothetical protein|nr:DUF402 domain-containing protein [Rhizomicrobium sp.]